MLQTYRLIAHPAHPPSTVRSVRVEVQMEGRDNVLIGYQVEPAEELLLPSPVTSNRATDLWTTTCFELFLKLENEERYLEYNFSPSSEWAIYGFDRYRDGMREFEIPVPPQIEIMEQGAHFHLDAHVDLAGIPQGSLRANFTAVIEERDGTKSYWAVAHAPDKPDFHDPSCFEVPLAPPNAP